MRYRTLTSLLLVHAMLLCSVSCEDLEKLPERPDNHDDKTPGILFLTAQNVHVDASSQEVIVDVTSSAAWTLSGNCDWVKPSQTSGQTGAKITFAVSSNNGTSRTVTYIFKAGNASSSLTITQNPH